jgi:ribonuclease BN (tRNA processing enzyme)
MTRCTRTTAGRLALACLALTPPGAAAAPAAAQDTPAESTTVILLGTGMPRPNPSASGPATAIVVGPRVFLFDAGAGVMQQVAAAGLPLSGPNALFITHLHSDHTLGYPDVILTSWVMRRHGALQVFGPPGLQAMTDHVLAAWAEDINIRTTGLERERSDYLAVAVHEIEPGVVYDSGGVRVTAIPVHHAEWPHAFAYRVDTPTQAIVISGDTRPSEALVEAAHGADVLIHEAYAASRLAPENRPGGDEWPAYMRASHTSDVELGALAARIQPKLLILYHLVRMGASDDELLAGVRAGGFTGRTVIGRDLDRY